MAFPKPPPNIGKTPLYLHILCRLQVGHIASGGCPRIGKQTMPSTPKQKILPSPRGEQKRGAEVAPLFFRKLPSLLADSS